jgi:hypothetical protein
MRMQAKTLNRSTGSEQDLNLQDTKEYVGDKDECVL